MTIHLHQGDLPADLDLGATIAVDTETMGLNPHRDRLCLVQLSGGDGVCHLVKFDGRRFEAPNLVAQLGDPNRLKLMHYARFDVAVIEHFLGVVAAPVYCTKIASKLTRTFTDRHGLSALCKDLLGVELSKQQQSSDWGADSLSEAQLEYAAADVLYLHRLKAILDELLAREGRAGLARAAFDFLPSRARLDLMAGDGFDLFAH